MHKNIVKNEENSKIIHYCKDCEKIIQPVQVGKKFSFKCPICKEKNVAFGTEKSIKNFYRIEEEEIQK